MYTELAQKFANYKLPNDFRVRTNFVKTLFFANENQINNDVIDYFMACPPYRMEDESYEDMKLRTRFAKMLLKCRAYLYDYSIYENN